MALACQAASISMGIGFPGDGVACAKEIGGAGLEGRGRVGKDKGTIGGKELREAWKALSVAEFWSIWVARWYQASGSVSDGRPMVIPARALEMRRSSPRQNFTTTVFGS